MKWTWTIKDLLRAMLRIALISGVYWNQQHGHEQFNRWLVAVLSVLLVPVSLYHFARRRQIIFLLAAIAVTCIGVHSAWLLAYGQFK